MSHVIHARNVNEALCKGLEFLSTHGAREPSRNGEVLVAPGPVLTVYERPEERVLFSAARDANPYFHLFEAIWMMAGREDVAFVAQFNGRMREFSDNGTTLHGAYGHRWRRRFGFDQLYAIVQHLKAQPNSRRAVLTMWAAKGDLNQDFGEGGLGAKDVPCNTNAYFDLRGGALNMTLCCRSNDIIWGAYGANAVHFTVLQEWVAAALGAPVGRFYQFSANYHAYVELPAFKALLANPAPADHYANGQVSPYLLLQPGEDAFHWLLDAERFCASAQRGASYYATQFFKAVALPLYESWRERRARFNHGREALARCAASDWRRAAEDWIDRRDAGKETSLER